MLPGIAKQLWDKLDIFDIIWVLPKDCNSGSWRLIQSPYKNSNEYFPLLQGLGRKIYSNPTYLLQRSCWLSPHPFEQIRY